MSRPDMPGSRHYRVRHVTTYGYAEEVVSSQLLAHLSPRAHPRQVSRLEGLHFDPAPSTAMDRLDWFGNPATYAALQTPHQTLTVTAEMAVTVAAPPPLDLSRTVAWERVCDGACANPGMAEFLFASPRVPVPAPKLAAYAAQSFPPGRPVGACVLDLTRRIAADFTFDATATTVSTPVLEVLETRRGVCQDFAHLMIAGLRSLGVPARYVSGYLRTLPPPGQPKLNGADASHAWVQAWCGEGVGWLDMDPTNATLAGLDHVTLAWGRDYDDVCPLRGVILGGGPHSVTVAVDVEEVEA